MQPFSTILFARMGSGVSTIQLMKMIAGVINPGRPVANLYVSSNLFTWQIFFAEFDHEKVFYVEPRRYKYFSDPCIGSQDWPVPKSPTSCYVSYPSMGYSYRLVRSWSDAFNWFLILQLSTGAVVNYGKFIKQKIWTV